MNSRLLLPISTGGALVGVAIVHLQIAGPYSNVGTHPLSLGDQFYAQAGIAFLIALALLVRPHLLVWLGSGAFAAGSLAVLIYSRYRAIPLYGLPSGFQESWSAKGAQPAAWFESIALVFSLAGATLLSRPHRGRAAPVNRP